MLVSWGQRKAVPKRELLSLIRGPTEDLCTPPYHCIHPSVCPPITSSDSTNMQDRPIMVARVWDLLGWGLHMVTPRRICDMFHQRLRNMGVQSHLGRPPIPLGQGTGPHFDCSCSIGPPMGRTPSPIPIRQPINSSIGELRVLSGSHTGMPTPVLFLASWQFTLSAKHIPGAQNSAADALSWNKASILLALVPHADPTPSPISSTLQDLLLAPDACWTSAHWRRGFRSFMLTVLLATLQEHKNWRSDVSSGFARGPV